MCDECAHGWLDGLNRLFMEAKLLVWLHGGRTEADLCRCFPPSSSLLSRKLFACVSKWEMVSRS